MPTIAEVLVAIASGNRAQAGKAAADCAVADPSNGLAVALARFLATSSGLDVYRAPAGFQEFIDNGANPALYAATIEHLGEIHATARPTSLVDIGPGDGRVTHAVLHHAIEEIHLVEPATELLQQAQRRQWPTPPVAHNATLDQFIADRAPSDHYDLCQATFAIHTIDPADRPRLLAGLARHTDRVVVVDFDIPGFVDGGPDHASYAADRYQEALTEYVDHPNVVDEFLLPVLVAQFDPQAKRLTYEQSSKSWADDFTAAGYRVSVDRLYDYWWAPAFVLDAVKRSG